MKKVYPIIFLVLPFYMNACSDKKSSDASIESESLDSGSESDISTDSVITTAMTVCGPLFGVPNEQSGLDSEQCRPLCDCDNQVFIPTQFSPAQLEELTDTRWLNPPDALTTNPYSIPEAYSEYPDKVCGIIFDAEERTAYYLETYDSADDAVAAGAAMTHTGACGLCSSLADLAVYARYPDLTSPVRQCGIEGVSGGETANMACLLELGFTEACAQIWYYNTLNTRTLCLNLCAAALSAPYHQADGTINDCLQCDEDNSGPVFKAVSGRTRRNSGLPTAICRPCESVSAVNHEYF